MEKTQSQRNGDRAYILQLKKQVKELQFLVVGLVLLLLVSTVAIAMASNLILALMK